MGLYDSARSFYYTWGSQFKGRYDKLIAYGIITLLSFFSLLDTCLMWANYKDLSSDDYKYALVTGHAGSFAGSALYALSVVSSMFCVVECVNMASMMTNGGHTRIPVELEQAVVLICVGIPSGAVNLSAVMCRHGDVTTYQLAGGLATLAKSALRMYAYGWLKETRFAYDRTAYRWTLKAAVYATASSTWLMAFVVQCYAWRHADAAGVHTPRTAADRLEAVGGVSVLLVGARDFDHADRSRHVGSYFSHRIGYCASTDRISFSNGTAGDAIRTRPVLIRNLSDVVLAAEEGREGGGDGFRVVYGCGGDRTGNDPVVPASCRPNDTSLVFRFAYRRQRHRKRRQPYGEIRYNVATLTDDRCRPLRRPLAADWQLHYFRLFLDQGSGDDAENERSVPASRTPDCVSARLEQAWVQDCFPPVPRYDPQLNVCG